MINIIYLGVEVHTTVIIKDLLNFIWDLKEPMRYGIYSSPEVAVRHSPKTK